MPNRIHKRLTNLSTKTGETMLILLQKAYASDRIDETCKTKEMITHINVMMGMEKEM